jgi:hypothetical protein
MTQNTLYAVDALYTVIDDLKKTEVNQKEIIDKLKELSTLEYRSEEQIRQEGFEKKVQKYIDAFLGGALNTYRIPEHLSRSGRSQATLAETTDLKFWCSKFSKEHFKYVRSAFWSLYKEAYKNRRADQYAAIEPYRILKTIKEIEENGKRDKKHSGKI